MLPEPLRPFFWDIDTVSFEPTAHPEYTIGRILELGDENAVRWLKQTFDRSQIEHVIRADRRLSRKSANFWALVYGIPAPEVAALASPPDPGTFADSPITRILEAGDEDEVCWLKQNFSRPEIERVIRTDRRLSRKSANFWALVYEIPTSEVAALS